MTEKSLQYKATLSRLAMIRIFTTLLALPVPIVMYFAIFAKNIPNPILRYSVGGVFILLSFGFGIHVAGMMFYSLKVEKGRFTFRRWWGSKSVELKDCENVQWNYDTLTTSKSGDPQFFIILTVRRNGEQVREIWHLGWAWKISEMSRFIIDIRKLVGLPEHGAEGQVRKSWTEIAGEE